MFSCRRIVAAVSLLLLAASALAETSDRRPVPAEPKSVRREAAAVPVRPDTRTPDKASAEAVLARFDFEGPGGPDVQGWTAHDLTEKELVAWHVEDFAGLGGSYAAPQGAQAL